jgi:hypothetical protein
MRVIIAEDSVLLREGIARLLTENGFNVVETVEDGEALIRRIATSLQTWRSSTSECPPATQTKGSALRSTSERTTPAWACCCSRSTRKSELR